MQSLQQRIGTWHRATFGPDCDARIHGLHLKFEEEAEEFATEEDADKKDWEAVDCYIVLMAWAARRGFDLNARAEQKFEIVRNRDQVKRDAERGIPSTGAGEPEEEE